MDDLNKELSELVADIRAHLEFQRALGVRVIELPSAGVRPLPESLTASDSRKPAPPSDRKQDEAPVIPQRIPEKPPAPAYAALSAICEEIDGCARCKLHTGRKSVMAGEGSAGAVLVFIGDAPGPEAETAGSLFAGEAGQLLSDIIVKGMQLRREEVYVCNVLKCGTPEGRAPEPDEVRTCGEFVKKQIAAIKPRVIVTLGNVPTQTLLATKEGITKLRGSWQTYDGIPVMPTFHPVYLLHSPGEKKKVWEDIRKVMAKLGMKK